MKIYENAMSEVLIELVDEAIRSIHFIEATESDRPIIKAEIMKSVKQKLKNKYNEVLDDDYLEVYIGDYIDDLATDIIEGKKVNEDTFSTGVTGTTGLVNGIPNSGDGIGLYAAPIGNKTTPKKKKKKKDIKVVIKK